MTRFLQISTRNARNLAAPVTAKLAMLIAGTAAALLIGLNPAVARNGSHAGTQFEIELVVFSREGGMQQARETWPATPRLSYPDHWLDFQTPAGSDSTALALQPVAGKLGNKVAALNRDSQYKVLFHKTWRQVLQRERNAPAILISGGPQSGNHHALEGSVTLSVSRYLHLSTDLWLSEFGLDSGSGSANSGTAGFSPASQGDIAVNGILVPTRPTRAIANWPNDSAGSSADEPMDLTANREEFGFNQAGKRTGNERINTPAYAQQVAVLQEERRLRSGELHYIDHPKLGVLIEVRTVAVSRETAVE